MLETIIAIILIIVFWPLIKAYALLILLVLLVVLIARRTSRTGWFW